MKNLPSISKIGRAALLRLFKPHFIMTPEGQSECEVDFPTQEWDLQKHLNIRTSSVHRDNLHADSSQDYLVWSIEIGLRPLMVLEDDSALDAISRLDCLKMTAPSHLIIRHWHADNISGKSETYKVHRLAQWQETAIKNRVALRQSVIDYVEVGPFQQYERREEGHTFGAEISYDGLEVNDSGTTEEEAREKVIRKWCNMIEKS